MSLRLENYDGTLITLQHHNISTAQHYTTATPTELNQHHRIKQLPHKIRSLQINKTSPDTELDYNDTIRSPPHAE